MIEPFSKFCVDALFHQDSRTSKISKKVFYVFYFVILTIYIEKTNLVGSIVLKSSNADKNVLGLKHPLCERNGKR